MNNLLIVITGTTQGLGKELKEIFKDNNILTLNRKSIEHSIDLILDLSEKILIWTSLIILLINIKKYFLFQMHLL